MQNFRTDLEYKNGAIVARNASGADSKEPLPKVEISQRISTAAWGTTAITEAGKLGGDVSLATAVHAHTNLVGSVSSLISMRDNQHPEITQATHLNKVAQSFDDATKRHSKAVENARTVVSNRLNSVESEFRSALKFDSRDAAEIRRTLLAMPAELRTSAIVEAINDGDGQLLAAVLDGHPISIGLKRQDQTNFRSMAMAKHTPDLLKLEKQLKSMDDLLFHSFNDFLMLDSTITAKQVREKYNKKTQAADEAQQQAVRY
jgi:hypothetical protein